MTISEGQVYKRGTSWIIIQGFDDAMYIYMTIVNGTVALNNSATYADMQTALDGYTLQ